MTTALVNRQPVTVSVTSGGASDDYTLVVPSGVDQLIVRVNSSGGVGSGQAHMRLTVKHGSAGTYGDTASWGLDTTTTVGTKNPNVHVLIPNPAAGTWYITMEASGGSIINAQLTACHDSVLTWTEYTSDTYWTAEDGATYGSGKWTSTTGGTVQLAAAGGGWNTGLNVTAVKIQANTQAAGALYMKVYQGSSTLILRTEDTYYSIPTSLYSQTPADIGGVVPSTDYIATPTKVRTDKTDTIEHIWFTSDDIDAAILAPEPTVDDVSELGTFTDAYSEVVASSTTEAGVLRSASVIRVRSDMVEHGVFSSSVDARQIFDTVERGVLRATAASGGTFRNDASERGRVRSRVALRVATETVDTGTLADAVRLAVATTTVERGTLGNATANPQRFINDISDRGVLSSLIRSAFSNNVVEVGTIVDAVSNVWHLRNNVVETGTLSSATLCTNFAVTLARSTGVIRSAVTSVLHARNDTVERGYFTDAALGGGAAGAWQALLETLAMTQYTNYPFRALAVVDGVLLGMGEDGVYVLEGDDDAGSPIAAAAVTDLVDLIDGKQGPVSVPNAKRAEYAYLGYAADGEVALTVAETNTGAEVSHSISMPAPPGDAMRAARARLIPGRPSRYFRFGIENVDGAAFNVSDARILFTVLQRRL